MRWMINEGRYLDVEKNSSTSMVEVAEKPKVLLVDFHRRLSSTLTFHSHLYHLQQTHHGHTHTRRQARRGASIHQAIH